jgi:Holliday junction resolvasome RuvABC endonuclease subunit
MTKIRSHVLGFHPSSRGFGWALFEDRLSLVDWGVFDFRASENAIALSRMETLFDKHHPGVLALERHENRRHQRIRRLCLAVVKSAQRRGIAVHRYSRTEIASSRFMKGASTRQEVAAAVADCLSALRQRLPKPRQIWVGERSAMRLFCAAACALAYFDANP